MRQSSSVCKFGSDSWIVLSPIEQRIKAKIEAVGTPLKDWNIKINYGIKTGCNEAFIISGTKRKELIEQDPKSEEIIRPILRGRDIKRYEYNFGDLWLINTHNGIKGKNITPIKIDDYPAIKHWLDVGGIAYNGKVYRGYKQIENRADQGDTPYNLRNCAYMEDFYKQKIIYPNMTKFLPFAYDDKGFLTNQKCFIITGKCVAFLSVFFNSSLFKYCFRDNFPELQGGTRELSKIFFEKIPVLQIDSSTNAIFESHITKLQRVKQNNSSGKDIELLLDDMIFDLYHLTQEEKATIGFIEIL